MWVAITNTFSKLTSATPEERSWLREYLSFDDARAYFAGRKDNKIRMFNLTNETFPTGFLSMVRKAAVAKGFQLDVVDQRVPPCLPDPRADLAWLRPNYQLPAVHKAAFMRRGLIKVPTGGGKTEIAVGITKYLPCEWLFVVHRGTLMDQAAERYEKRTGLVAGRIGEGMWSTGHFTVATFQTLYMRLREERMRAAPHPPSGPAHQLLARVGGLMVDEAHVLPADSFFAVIMACQAYYRIGLSATPLARGDRRSVLAIAALGPVIYSISAETLVAEGAISKPKIRMLPVYQESQAATYQGAYGELVVRSVPRNATLVEACKKAKKPALLFVKEIGHGEKLRQRLDRAHITNAFVFGNDDIAARKLAIQRLVRGEIEVLICSVIFQEGVDIPSLQSVVIGAAGQSVIAALQRIGRGSRIDKASGKTEFEVWDILDRGNKWMEKHAKKRMNSYAAEGYEVTVVAGSLAGAGASVVPD